MKRIDLTDQTFGRLHVLNFQSSIKGKVRWNCMCSCGNSTIVETANLRHGHTLSCGCLNSEVNSERAIKRNTVHGHNLAGNASRTHNSWSAMIKRCSNKGHKSYKDYGGRGISVCDRWRSFANFLSDMGERPIGMTIDRIENNGNYEKNNCKWSTLSEQQKNTRVYRGAE